MVKCYYSQALVLDTQFSIFEYAYYGNLSENRQPFISPFPLIICAPRL